MNCFKIPCTSIYLIQRFCFFVWILTEFAATGVPIPDDSQWECIGKHEIPLNGNHTKFEENPYEHFSYLNVERQPTNVLIENNGHTLMIHWNFSDDARPTIFNGPLTNIGTFSVALVYWHWLEKSNPKYDYGNTSFPAEIHLVFYNTKYSSWMEATAEDNGIVVFAFHLQVAPFSSNYFDDVTLQLAFIREEYAKVDLPQSSEFTLNFFMYQDLSKFYMYHGTMLNVACVRDVIWLDFPTVISVKKEFFQQIQLLQAGDKSPLMTKIQHSEPPKGVVTKSKSPHLEEDHHSSIPFIDTLGGGTSSSGNSHFIVIFFQIILFLY